MKWIVRFFKNQSVASWAMEILFLVLLNIYIPDFWRIMELLAVFIVYGIYRERDGKGQVKIKVEVGGLPKAS